MKETISDALKIDEDTKVRARLTCQHALYAKLFGKAPVFEYIKTVLLGQWQEFGRISISDMPNGFMLIRCETNEAKKKIDFRGPWNINGLTFQISQWQPFFELATTKLTKAIVWVQLHNLPFELWDGQTLDSITEPLGKLLKVDELTSSLSRARFARVYLEIDLTSPLKRGFWLDDGYGN